MPSANPIASLRRLCAESNIYTLSHLDALFRFEDGMAQATLARATKLSTSAMAQVINVFVMNDVLSDTSAESDHKRFSLSRRMVRS